ncbi:hypothetical protein RvY_16285, partial [Ramazzottius varieornatus]
LGYFFVSHYGWWIGGHFRLHTSRQHVGHERFTVVHQRGIHCGNASCTCLPGYLSATVGLPGDYGDLSYGGFSVSIQQFSLMSDDAFVLLSGAWKEPRHIDERDYRNVEGVEEANEARAFYRSVDIQTTFNDFFGWFPTISTVLPFTLPNPVMIFLA